jgi:hypothetical protein
MRIEFFFTHRCIAVAFATNPDGTLGEPIAVAAGANPAEAEAALRAKLP